MKYRVTPWEGNRGHDTREGTTRTCSIVPAQKGKSVAFQYRLFTLVEVVAALGILCLVAMLTAGILQSVQQLWGNIQECGNELETLQNIDRIADYAMKNMVPFRWRDPDGRERQVFCGNSDSIIFAHLHRSVGPDSGGIRFIELRIEDKRLVARYRQTPILHWLGEPVGDSDVAKEVVADKIASLSFEYADREGDEIVWREDWNEEEKKQIPLAILMKIRFENGTEEQWLRRSAGSSWNTAYGRRQY